MQADQATGALRVKNITASQIVGGQFSSDNFEAGESDFRINTAGNAEFNEVSMRGVMRSGRIETSHILAPTITLPTEADARFQTQFLPRQVGPSFVHYNDHYISSGWLRIQPDSNSHLFQDKNSYIYCAHDVIGDDAAALRNDVHTRFRSFTPLMNVTLHFQQPSGNWGKIIRNLAIVIKCTAENRGTIIQSPSINISPISFLANSHISTSQTGSQTADGFEGSIHHVTSRVYQKRPGYTATTQGYTSSYTVELTFRPIIGRGFNLNNSRLRFDFAITPNASNLNASAIYQNMVPHFSLHSDSLS